MINALLTRALLAVPADDPKPYQPKQPTAQLPGNVADKLNSLLGMLMAIVVAACIAGVLLVAIKLAVAYRHGEMGEAAGKLAGVAVACIVAGSAAALVGWFFA